MTVQCSTRLSIQVDIMPGKVLLSTFPELQINHLVENKNNNYQTRIFKCALHFLKQDIAIFVEMQGLQVTFITFVRYSVVSFPSLKNRYIFQNDNILTVHE